MKLLPLEIHGITDKQKLNAMAFTLYQHSKWEPKVGDYYTITRADNQLCRIVGEGEETFWVKLSWPTGQVSEASEFPKEGFNTKDFGVNRIYVPEWALKVEPPMMKDSYYLSNRKMYSLISDQTIRSKFEKRMTKMGYGGDFERQLSGCYHDDFLQTRWEEYYNGFREAEDTI